MIGPDSLHWVTHWSRERRRFWTTIFHLVTDEGFQRGSGSIRQVFMKWKRLMGTPAKIWGGLLGKREGWRAAAY